MISVRPAFMRRAMAFLAGPVVFLCACEDLPQEPPLARLGAPHRTWFVATIANTGKYNMIELEDQTAGGVINVVHRLGSMIIYPAGRDSIARGEVFSNATGETYWVGAQAPTRSDWPRDSTIGVEAALLEAWRFRKDSPDAVLQLRITGLHLEAFDHNGTAPGFEECPWADGAPIDSIPALCAREMMLSRAFLRYWLYSGSQVGGRPLWSIGEDLTIRGYAGSFEAGRHTPGNIDEGVFYRHQLDFDEQPDHVQVRLAESPVVVDIPLIWIPVGGVFELHSSVVVRGYTKRQRESYASAYFRDPVGMSGASFVLNGLTVLPPPDGIREPDPPSGPAPACGTDGTGSAEGAAGTIGFGATAFRAAERSGAHAEVTLTRSGGSAGAASVQFSTAGGTASTGSDYEPVTTHVWFAAGSEGTRVVYVPIADDDTAEPDETIRLTLSSPGGCASLGLADAELVIMDDDRPRTATARTIGGTVAGLEGSGLVLTNVSTDHLTITGNGPFVFARDYSDGHIYQVRVHTQPTDPSQSCSVTNGNGTVAGADIRDVEIICATLPPPPSGLDPSFGSEGRVTSEAIGPIADMALQPDGRIVVVGGDKRTGARLARFEADGTLDRGFGQDGIVSVVVHGATYDVLNAVAVQPDGGIVVAGYSKDGANSPTHEDWIVARYTADGTLDAGFGTGGRVITDFHGRGDGAYDVLIAADGGIIVVGNASIIRSGVADSDFAVARYTADGAIDTSFGTGGNTIVAVAGPVDIAHAAALQPDGRIVVVGRAATSGGSDPDVGIVRLNADGSLDDSFAEAGVLHEETSGWDEAADVAVQPDGRIVVAGQSGSGVLLVARFNADGSRDGGFGVGGRALDVGGIGRAAALQPDGSIIATGWVPTAASSDVVVARLAADGAVDPSFGADGTMSIDFFGGSDVANAVVIQPDGRILVAGSAVNGARTWAAIVRVVP